MNSDSLSQYPTSSMDYMIKDHNKWVNGSLTPSMQGLKKPDSSSVNDTAERRMADTFFAACFFNAA